jgi:hypothetical protein
LRNDHTTALPPPDIGSIIQSFLTTAIPAPAPSVHTEVSESGWEVVTSRFHKPHMEVSTDGFDQTTHVAPAPDNRPQVTASGAQVTEPPYVPVPVPAVTPPPVITQGGVTLRPVAVTSVRVTNVDGKPTTVEATVNYRYVVGSATLTPGTPATINNVVVALSVDAAGKTVLVAGDTTTTLPAAPARAAQATTAAVQIATTVVEGTTKYVLAGQTLAPGQAITVGNIPISIGTAGASQTVLVMGDMTTTLAAGPTTTLQEERGPSSAVTPGVGGGNGPNNPSATTKASGEASCRAAMSWRLIVESALFLGLAFATT